MASSREYLEYVLDQLSPLGGVSYRAMMGEYVVYFGGKVVGGIYDDRFLIKPTASAKRMIVNATYELPYEGAKEMLQVDVDDRELLCRLVSAVADDLPSPKPKKAKGECK